MDALRGQCGIGRRLCCCAPVKNIDRSFKREGINGHCSETCPEWSESTALVEYRTDVDGAAGVAGSCMALVACCHD